MLHTLRSAPFFTHRSAHFSHTASRLRSAVGHNACLSRTTHPMSNPQPAFTGLNIAVLTVSDTRNEQTDTSGAFLADALTRAGHQLKEKRIVRDNRYDIRAVVSAWIADTAVSAVIITGGTGLTGRDVTPEAITPLFDKTIDGFGELFRYVSITDIGTSTVQSRALGGLANGTLIFALPGSSNACRTAWDKILKDQLDIRFRPCNFAELIPRFQEH